jgi:hypothetical protein
MEHLFHGFLFFWVLQIFKKLNFILMNKKILFHETQRFNFWWIWLPLLLVVSYAFYGIARQLLTGEKFGDKPPSDGGVIILACILLLVLALFRFMKLETIITEEGIYVQLFPFHLRHRFISWERIRKCSVRSYKPLMEYGGWGLRYGLGGWAYNVAGNIGLQIEYDSNKRLLIGTQKPKELVVALEQNSSEIALKRKAPNN